MAELLTPFEKEQYRRIVRELNRTDEGTREADSAYPIYVEQEDGVRAPAIVLGRTAYLFGVAKKRLGIED